ncbi:DUF6056 family protein [Pseudobutyrivibrio xylanivorans]|uniref:Uncharacterized protein n=1 Tax=Pseudobutyrivibrio xylanivorans TaxID=185007 RepID=A0A5P6VUX9_PSEXY|nr:DUF6056 family protein [Pseudobutyrivibrio xylanivorans]QFJ56310.1 hypothetical protein FXF36_15440 [Pseudobutyrivibrio xylanivorans]
MEEKCKSLLVRLYFIIDMVIFTFFLIINIHTPLIAEDYALLAIYPYEKVSNPIEILARMSAKVIKQMLTWNVRVGEQLSIVFGCFDKDIFNVLNTLMSLYFLLLIQLYAFKTERSIYRKLISTITAFSLIILCQPVLGEIFFWKTGSTNYLWGMCILLTFALPLRFIIGENSIDIIGNSVKKNILFCLLGLVAGITNENTVGAVWIVYLVYIIWGKIKSKKHPLWIYTTFLFYTIGFVFMLKAPSTKIRVDYYNNKIGVGKLTIYDYFIRACRVVGKFIYYDYMYILLTIILIIICYHFKKKVSLDISFFECLIMLFILGTLSSGALILSPYIEIRAFFLTQFMMLVCMVYYMCELLECAKVKISVVSGGIIVGLTLLLALTMHNIFSVYSDYQNYCEKRNYAALMLKEDFYWGEYWKHPSERILNTREVLLRETPNFSQKYYNKDFDVIKKAIWDLEIDSYEEVSSGGNASITKNGDDYFIDGYTNSEIVNNTDVYVSFFNDREVIYRFSDIGEIQKDGAFTIKITTPEREKGAKRVMLYVVDRKQNKYERLDFDVLNIKTTEQK